MEVPRNSVSRTQSCTEILAYKLAEGVSCWNNQELGEELANMDEFITSWTSLIVAGGLQASYRPDSHKKKKDRWIHSKNEVVFQEAFCFCIFVFNPDPDERNQCVDGRPIGYVIICLFSKWSSDSIPVKMSSSGLKNWTLLDINRIILGWTRLFQLAVEDKEGRSSKDFMIEMINYNSQ